MGKNPSVNGKHNHGFFKPKWDYPSIMDFKEKIKFLMEQKGYNQKSLSLAAGLGETAVRDILMGRIISPKIKTLEKIAGVLDCEVESLLSAASLAQKSLETKEVSKIPVDSDAIIGLLRALSVVFAILTKNSLIRDQDLQGIFMEQMRLFGSRSQPIAAQVMEQLIASLAIKPGESEIQAIRKLLSHH